MFPQPRSAFSADQFGLFALLSAKNDNVVLQLNAEMDGVCIADPAEFGMKLSWPTRENRLRTLRTVTP